MTHYFTNFTSGTHPEFFTVGGGADPEAVYNLFDLKTVS